MENQPVPSEQHLKALVKDAQDSLHAAMLDKAVAQGKFEIASDVLHDIGNAVVGFGSYLTRIRRSLEQDNLQNLQNLAAFFVTQQTAMATIIGEAKSGAVVSMMKSIAESQKVSHEEIHKSMTEQLNLITHVQEILNIQRQYVTGHESHEKKATNLRSIVNDCISMLLASIDKRNIRVALDIPAEAPVILGDRTKLMQVMLNILKNSIEAIPIQATEKTISVRLHTEASSLILEIRDNGNGFDKATAGRLFERGFTTKSSGTGLGLNNCKAIVESHGGTIYMSSEGPGKGAITMIRFNILAGSAKEPGVPSK